MDKEKKVVLKVGEKLLVYKENDDDGVLIINCDDDLLIEDVSLKRIREVKIEEEELKKLKKYNESENL